MFSKQLLPLAILACSTLASPSKYPRQSEPAIEFCTESYYATGECPISRPTSGAGTCGTFAVEPDQCYTFANYTNVPSGLENNVNYIFIPSNTSISNCNLYKTLNCTITEDMEFDSCDVGSTDLLCRVHLSATITSWFCS